MADGIFGRAPAATGSHDEHTRIYGIARSRRDLPFYCNPVSLFLLIWMLMLGALSFHVTYVTYPTMGIPLLIFGISTASLFLGSFVARSLLRRGPRRPEVLSYTIDITRLWQLNALMCIVCLGIIAFNWITQGPPPALGASDTYLTYGRLKQILFPLLVSVVVNAVLDSSVIRKVLFGGFGLFWMLAYITRGNIIITLLEILFIFSLRTSIGKRKVYSVAILCFVFTAFAADAIGNARTTQIVFFEFMQIRPMYFEWPMVYLWLISYISAPFSNLCWLLDRFSFHGPTLAFLYPLLPSFWTPPDPYIYIRNDSRIIDGVSTYLMSYVLDFSYLGIFLANLCLGLGCGWLQERGGPKKMLVSGIFLACMSLIFFVDYFTILSTVIQLFVQSYVQRECFRWNDLNIASEAEA